jgi:hypothetical protein
MLARSLNSACETRCTNVSRLDIREVDYCFIRRLLQTNTALFRGVYGRALSGERVGGEGFQCY